MKLTGHFSTLEYQSLTTVLFQCVLQELSHLLRPAKPKPFGCSLRTWHGSKGGCHERNDIHDFNARQISASEEYPEVYSLQADSLGTILTNISAVRQLDPQAVHHPPKR